MENELTYDSDCDFSECDTDNIENAPVNIYEHIDKAFNIYLFIKNFITYNNLPICENLNHLDIVNMLEKN